MAVSIQIDRLALIKRLEQRLKEIPAEVKAYDKARKDYEVALKKWALKVMSNNKNVESVETSYRGVSVSLTEAVVKTAPEAPEKPAFHSEHQVKYATKEINDTLAVLRLSTNDTVGTSVTKTIAQYL